jgi:hypothetical protein
MRRPGGHLRRLTAPLLLACLLALPAHGRPQAIPERPAVTAAPDSATVGDRITVTLLAPGAEPGEVSWPAFPEGRVGELTLLEADTADGRTRRELGGPALILTTAAFDTGTVSTGPLWVAVGGDTTRFPAKTVTIVSVLAGDTLRGQLAPLKAQEDLPLTFADLATLLAPWVAAAGAALLAWWLIRRWILRRRRRGEFAGEEIPELSPYEEARRALEALKADNPLARGDQKAYVAQLAHIVKRLFERTHMDPVLEMTTWEVRRWLASTPVLCGQEDVLAILEAGDTVKFARGALAPGEDERLLEAAQRIVEAYRPREESAGPSEAGAGVGDAAEETAGGSGDRAESGQTAPDTAPGETGVAEEKQPGEWRMHTARSGANRGRRR